MGLCVSTYKQHDDDEVEGNKTKTSTTNVIKVAPPRRVSSQLKSNEKLPERGSDRKTTKTIKLSESQKKVIQKASRESSSSRLNDLDFVDGKDSKIKTSDFVDDDEDNAIMNADIGFGSGLSKAITNLNNGEEQINIIKEEHEDSCVEEESNYDLGDEKVTVKIDIPHTNTNLDNLLKNQKEIVSEHFEKEESYLDNYKIKKLIRETEDKKIYEGIENETYMPVRIIQVKKNNNLPARKYIVPEVGSCPHIEHNLTVFESPSMITIIQAYRKSSSLSDIVQHIKSEKHLLYVIFQIINAVAHLHKQGITNNKITVDSFNVISDFKKEFFNIKLFDYSLFAEDNHNIKSDFYDISIIFYYLIIKKMPYENLEAIKYQMESTLSKYTLSLLVKLSATNSDLTLRKLMDHKSFHIYDINMSTMNVLINPKFMLNLIERIESRITTENLEEFFSNKKDHSNASTSKVEAAINFFCTHILVGKGSISLEDSMIEKEEPIDIAFKRLQENFSFVIELINNEVNQEVKIDTERVISTLKGCDKITCPEDIRKVIQFSLIYKNTYAFKTGVTKEEIKEEEQEQQEA